MNKAEKSLRWVVNQIPDFKPTTNEEKMLVTIKLYSEAGAKEISRLEVENAKLKEMLSRVKSGRVSKIKSENAALRERLEKAVELQYAVGNEVFIVVGDEQRELEIKKAIIEQYFIDDMLFSKKFSVKVFLRIGHTKYIEYVELLKSRWFLSYEEAEARLKELKGGKNE